MKTIGSGDMEFYYAPIVRKMAFLLSGYTSENDWNRLSYRTKTKWLDRAVRASCALVNDEHVASTFPSLVRSLGV